MAENDEKSFDPAMHNATVPATDKPGEENPRRFELKGKKAEAFLHDLATKSFFTDWCYPNAILGPGKECDLLIVFDDTVIIWQAKDLKLDKNGRYSEKEVQKNIRQLAGARRALFDLKAPITLINPRRGSELFDPSPIRRVFLISALLGEPQDFDNLFDEAKGHAVHVFTREFAEIALTELDTISDFTGYLNTVEELLFTSDRPPRVIVQGGEDELLGLYVLNNRTIPVFESGAFTVSIQEGHWAEVQARPEYVERKRLDEISYVWDGVIDGAHTSGDPEYELVVRELARLNRFQRRFASKHFLDALSRANADARPVYRRTVIADGFTLCFLFTDQGVMSNEYRRAMLGAHCFVTRGLPQARENSRVIGIATEKQLEVNGSWDIAYFYLPEWTEEMQQQAEELKSEFNLMTNPQLRQVKEQEYPEQDVD